MPLNKARTKKAFGQNIKTEVDAGRPQKQAIAIAYSVKGEKKPKSELAAALTKKKY